MSKDRVTYETLTAGQPRPYADSIYRYRIYFEWQGMAGYKDKNAPFVPRDKMVATSNPHALAMVTKFAKAFSGWSEPTDHGFDWASTKLDYIKEVGPGVWEFQTSSAYTD